MNSLNRDREEEVLDILNSLVQEIGHQVTRDYDFKGGIWEGMSIDNEKSRQKYAKVLLTLLEEAKAEERQRCLEAEKKKEGWHPDLKLSRSDISFNEAIDQAISAITNSSKNK